MDHDDQHVEGEEQTELKRAIGPKLLLLFIVGDILGTGVYALTGEVASEVGGAAWAPFIVAFAIALVTAFSYLELVTKYPQAAGAALYTHKAFGIHFVTFLVAFTVMCSGITSASTASQAFAANLADGFGLDEREARASSSASRWRSWLLVAAVNFRGVGESVKANVVLTLVELSGLLLVILVGFYAATGGKADFSRVIGVRHPERQERLPRGHGGDVAGLLRDGRLRGLREHGRGDQGPGADLPEDDAHRHRHHRRHLRARRDLRGGPGAGRPSSARATRR